MENKCVIMCSGGPDSMALLDMMYKEGKEIIVAHVNYQKRETARRDELIVEEYCRQRNIVLEKLYPKYESQGNFQGWARDIRYEFALRTAEENGIETIMVAHHLDDVLETYLMQKRRGATPDYYGIDSRILMGNISIERPLLDMTKEDLENYCRENNVDYGIDESNLGNDYTRNQIRHSVIDELSLGEKHDLLKEINELNRTKQEKEERYQKIVDENRFCNLNTFEGIEDKDLFIRLFIDKGLSKDFVGEIIRQLMGSDKVSMQIKDRILIKEYGIFYIYQKKDYSYSFEQLEMKETEYFGIRDTGNNFEGVTVSETDFPITIRNYQEGDKINMLYGGKKLSRWFIDNKILTCHRHLWPVVINSENEIILVPGIGCNSTHYSNNPTFFVIQYLLN